VSPVLEVKAVRKLEQEDVVAGGGQDITQVAPQRQVARVAVVGPVLGPDHIEQRPWPVFPPQHRRSPPRFIIKIRIADDKRCGRSRRSIRVNKITSLNWLECRAPFLSKN